MDLAQTPPPSARAERDVYTVSRLNREVRVLLERGLGTLWLEAEISNFARPSSGHWYFSLKDGSAQVRCCMFRQRNMLAKFLARDGQKVLVRARISLYEPRGDYQLIIDHLEDAGQGALKRQFEELSARLAAEGLFAPERKRALPPLPLRIGVITSPTGAALRDIIHVLRRRFPAAAVLIYPVAVQGAQAAPEIIAALTLACARGDCDVLILARGGGSLEDLWSFNDEGVARAISAATIPVISGIGHEIDFTIADFVADVRAPTPSAAAELVVPDSLEWQAAFARHAQRLAHAVRRRLQQHAERLGWLRGRAAQVSPVARLAQQTQRLDELEQRLQRALRRSLDARSERLRWLRGRATLVSPAARLALRSTALASLAQRLQGAWQRQASAQRAAVGTAGTRHAALDARLRHAAREPLRRARERLVPLIRTLHAVSPLATLERGYAIVKADNGDILRDAAPVQPGTTIEARLAHGTLHATVTSTS